MESKRITPRPEPLVQHLHPLALVTNLWGHRSLIWQFSRREVEGRYRASVIGVLWTFVYPLAQLLAYTWVLGIVFRARWPTSRTGGLGEFSLMLFSGLVVFNVFAECLNRAATLVVAVPNYVKKVVFPLEILPVSLLGSAVFHGLVSLAVLLVCCRLVLGELPATVLLIPLVALPAAFLCLGLTWLMASLGVFLRDLTHIVPLILTIAFFATPVLYPADAVPERFRVTVLLNPLAWVLESLRGLLFAGTLPDWGALAAWGAVTAGVMVLGYAWFMKTKRGFADVL
ncbi:MAG TPA: ABC transporter permease [Vicinamibacteria bacterium]